MQGPLIYGYMYCPQLRLYTIMRRENVSPLSQELSYCTIWFWLRAEFTDSVPTTVFDHTYGRKMKLEARTGKADILNPGSRTSIDTVS